MNVSSSGTTSSNDAVMQAKANQEAQERQRAEEAAQAQRDEQARQAAEKAKQEAAAKAEAQAQQKAAKDGVDISKDNAKVYATFDEKANAKEESQQAKSGEAPTYSEVIDK